MAMEVGDDEFALRARKIFESGSRLTPERLWNGDYFIQDTDVSKYDWQYGDGCLSDQVFGQGWAHLLGLGYIYPKDHVKKTLQSIWKYNWAPDVGTQNKDHPPERVFASPSEPGLFTCTWPKSPHLEGRGVRYRSEVWTGIEYQVAGHMINEGMLEEGLSIIRGIHERYHPSKHNPYNEVECGDHYARAMASWGAFTALSGYEYHGPKGHLGFDPKITPEDFRSAFTCAEGWGSFSQVREGNEQVNTIEVNWGQVSLKSLSFSAPKEATNVSVTVGRRRIKSVNNISDGRIHISLPREINLKAGQTLTIKLGG